MEFELRHPGWLRLHEGPRPSLWGRFHFDPGIRWLLTLGIVGVIVTLMAATTIIDVRDRRADIRSSMERTGRDFATIANSVLPDAIRERDNNELGKFASAIWGQRDTSYVKIFDRDGNLLVGPGEDQYPRGVNNTSVVPQVADLRTVLRWTDEGLEVIAPISSGAQVIGAVQFGFDTARIDDEIRTLTLNRIWQTLILVCLGGFGSVLLANYFVRPIRLLVQATQKLASGELSTRVEPLRGREMRNLSDSFNSMAGELQSLVTELQESRSRIVSGEERVRREIAAHLHGPVQGRLLALRAQLDEVLQRQDVPDEATRRLSGIVEEMGRVIQSDIASLSRRLYPAIVRRGLIPALQSLCDQFDATLNLELRYPDGLLKSERANSGLIQERSRLAAYRIVNEALANAVKHVGQAKVRVAIEGLDDGWLTVSVSDEGPGFDPEAQSPGLGLTAMRDYAEAIGGLCTVQSSPGRGCSVTARLPG